MSHLMVVTSGICDLGSSQVELSSTFLDRVPHFHNYTIHTPPNSPYKHIRYRFLSHRIRTQIIEIPTPMSMFHLLCESPHLYALHSEVSECFASFQNTHDGSHNPLLEYSYV